jgi:hypothetical protein
MPGRVAERRRGKIAVKISLGTISATTTARRHHGHKW